jgi:hypothetical protein
MRDGFCKSHYPKPLSDTTILQHDSYPVYRRRANGPRTTIRHPPGSSMEVGNEWVVPYNPYLCWKYKSHINVEACQGLNSLKYIHKYIHKGPDRATVQFDTGPNEIQQYISGRYIGSMEAAWRIFEFPRHEHAPSVIPSPTGMKVPRTGFFRTSKTKRPN